MKPALLMVLGCAFLAQPGYASGVVCTAIPSAAYNQPEQGGVPADVNPRRDDWAKQDVTLDVLQPVNPDQELRVARTRINPETGKVTANNRPLPSETPADAPETVIVCRYQKG